MHRKAIKFKANHRLAEVFRWEISIKFIINQYRINRGGISYISKKRE